MGLKYEGYYSTAQTAEILELSPRQVRNLVFEGSLREVRDRMLADLER
ncbi:MAG: hypothetical protein H0T57_02160 [Rubrobacter sp.]|nr:hypothetical protein [Rubrobacter sp.]